MKTHINGVVPGWLLFNVAALSSVLAHIFIDSHLGLYGDVSPSMSLLQATNVALTCLVIAWWILCLVATTGPARPGLSGAFILAVLGALLSNGLAAMVTAPPPADAFPYQDLTHLLSAAFGALAALTTWREIRRSKGQWSWAWSGVALLLLGGLFVAQGVLSQPNL